MNLFCVVEEGSIVYVIFLYIKSHVEAMLWSVFVGKN